MSVLFDLTPSSSSTMASPSPSPLSPDFKDIVCNAPLVTPIPLPCLSPTFLQFLHLPDPDNDGDDSDSPDSPYRINHIPGIPAKRKRAADDEIVSLGALFVDSYIFSSYDDSDSDGAGNGGGPGDYPPAKRMAHFPSSYHRPSHRFRR